MRKLNSTTQLSSRQVLRCSGLILVLSVTGCANIQDTSQLENEIAQAQKGSFGLCMDESYRAAEELQEAKIRLKELQDGSPSDTDMREGMRAAKTAVELRNKAEQVCANEYRVANQADAARMAELQAQLAELNERLREVESKREVLRGVTFATGSARLSTQSKIVLANQADKLVREGHRVQVAGYASTTGTVKHNLELSSKRAEAVRSYLITSGVSADKIVAKGFGVADPIAPNTTESGRLANQRIELHYL